MHKPALRRQMKARRAALSPEARAEASARILAHVLAHPAWSRAERVGLYHAMPQEVATPATPR
ncbi:MAG: hypothetical protein H6741_23355 [Alphaproteobacteria bacterium]|nr:hypothetical protein [Alphaproteobacteria bacterium]MCB9795646.1 hypothetical protein [Alphaproteobacteria bacterium]